MNTHSLANALQQLLMAANPSMWGKLPILKPKSTRRFIAGKEETRWVAEVPPAPHKPVPHKPASNSVPALSEVDALVQLQTCVRALPRVFTEDEVPPQLRGTLPRMEQLGILRCTSRKRAEIKQYLRVGV